MMKYVTQPVESFIDRTLVDIVPRSLAGGGGAHLSFLSDFLKLYLDKRNVLVVSLGMGDH